MFLLFQMIFIEPLLKIFVAKARGDFRLVSNKGVQVTTTNAFAVWEEL